MRDALIGMERVNLMLLSGIAVGSSFEGGVSKITHIQCNGERAEFLFKNMGEAIHNIVHNAEVDEQALWADIGENPTTKVIEPYVHFNDLESFFNDRGDTIRFILTDSHDNREELHLEWVPFTAWNEPLV